MTDFPEFVEWFAMLGKDFPPSNELVNKLNKFTCLLYADNVSKTVDDCRYALFKSGKCSDDVLPPTCDSLVQHIYRANFQAASWYQCLSAEVNVPSPVGNGWALDDEELKITWMIRPPAPQSLIECVECKCKTGCSTMRCSCKKADLKCTDLCSCCDCQNEAAGDDDDADESSCDLAQSDDDDEIGGSDLDFSDDDLWY